MDPARFSSTDSLPHSGDTAVKMNRAHWIISVQISIDLHQ